jgi:hypothetical protein
MHMALTGTVQRPDAGFPRISEQCLDRATNESNDLSRRSRRARGERGASLVEFALIIPIVLGLVFGIVEFGMAFNNYISIRQGIREGARQAVVANFGTNSSCTTTGGSPSTETKELMCLTKDRAGLGSTKDADLRVSVSFPNGYTVGNSVIICSEYPANSVTKLFQPLLNGKVLKSKTEMRIEQTTQNTGAGAFAAAEETAQSGSWTWCHT